MAIYPYLSRQSIATAALKRHIGFAFDIRNVAGFTRISGVASIIGSASIRMRGALPKNGPFVTSSTWNVNSGVSLLDVPNYVSWPADTAKAQACTVKIILLHSMHTVGLDHQKGGGVVTRLIR